MTRAELNEGLLEELMAAQASGDRLRQGRAIVTVEENRDHGQPLNEEGLYQFDRRHYKRPMKTEEPKRANGLRLLGALIITATGIFLGLAIHYMVQAYKLLP